METGLLIYSPLDGKFNIGDYIQSLAARQFFNKFPSVWIDRDKMGLYKGEEVKVILNGWFTHIPENWPPSPAIHPLFVAFHINETVKGEMLSEQAIIYYKQHEPIGCRDYNTCDMLRKNGVEAYFSGCLTLTLGLSYQVLERNDIVYIVDPYYQVNKDLISVSRYITSLFFHYKTIRKIARKIGKEPVGLKKLLKTTAFFRLYRKIASKSVLISAEYIQHEYQAKDFSTEDVKFRQADKLLNLYASAKYVITSRIHCALPCLAMETPVIYIKNNDANIVSSCRLGGISDFFHIIEVSGEKVVHSFFKHKLKMTTCFVNKTLHKEIRDKLIDICRKFTGE